MERQELQRAKRSAMETATAAGDLIRRNLRAAKQANEVTQHDIKLELDVRSQRLIEGRLRATFPAFGFLGEEDEAEAPITRQRWVVDPIDGTVNFAYGIPHACISIALQEKAAKSSGTVFPDGYETLVGIVYDPFRNEMWTAMKGQPAQLNGKAIRVSPRRQLNETIISVGFAKTRENLESTLPYFAELAHRVRKIRIMGSAALDLVYVATGRFDAYVENGVRIWDVAAGGLIIECAGGRFWRRPLDGQQGYRIIATNGRIHRVLHGLFKKAWR